MNRISKLQANDVSAVLKFKIREVEAKSKFYAQIVEREAVQSTNSSRTEAEVQLARMTGEIAGLRLAIETLTTLVDPSLK